MPTGDSKRESDANHATTELIAALGRLSDRGDVDVEVALGAMAAVLAMVARGVGMDRVEVLQAVVDGWDLAEGIEPPPEIARWARLTGEG